MRILAFWRSEYSVLIVLVLIGLGAGRIIDTYKVFSQTNDEPPHIACGLEWIELGSYNYEPQHPPLARVAVALGPYLDGARIPEHSRTLLKKLTKERA